MKNSKVVLVVIYNHRFDKNIDIIEKIYKGRFSNIFHLMPFYTGNIPNVIPVYEHSHYFQGFITQGFEKFYNKSADNYIFLSDDLILNPVINEKNYKDHFKLGEHTNFLISKNNKWNSDKYWPWTINALNFERDYRGINVSSELPTYDEAIKIMTSQGIKIEQVSNKQLLPRRGTNRYYSKIARFILDRLDRKKITWTKYKLKSLSFFSLLFSIKNEIYASTFPLSYPLVWSHADLVVVNSKNIKKFVHYCGIFAACNLFVEIALPTALVLSEPKQIVDCNNLLFRNGHLWNREQMKLLKPFDECLQKLLENFPEEYLYIHPVKLSKWNCSL